jgi:hypothetical protein
VDLSINEGTLVVTGGLGDSIANAIVIKKTPKGLSAAGAEMLILTQRLGPRTGWQIKQMISRQESGRTYDTYAIQLQDGTERSIIFDVTEWLGRASRI